MIDTRSEDPKRWTEGSAPEGALALLASLDEPPPLPPLVRKRVGKSVRAATGTAPAVPWVPILLAAAVALLAFAAGWLWSGHEPPPEQPTLATPFDEVEEPSAPTEAISERAMPAGSMEPEPSAQIEEPPEERAPMRIRRRSRSGTHPDLLDPFADRPRSGGSPMAIERSAGRTMRGNAGELRDPFANRPATPEASMGEVLNPFRRPGRATGEGEIVVNSIPWARVFLDGRDTGRNTPVRSLKLRAGQHQLGLRTPDGTMHTFTITVRAGETHRVMRRL